MAQADRIDVREIIAKYSIEEHAARADAYFSQLTPAHPVAKKPWASAHEAPEIAAGISAILAGMELFHGARVLDFGCGTGWMGRLLSDLGCEVTSMDISARALALSAQIEAAIAHEKDRVRYRRFDGHAFDADDASFDRIVCFDAFHHVPNPEEVLKEMHRVLVAGGIAAFHEPGPQHSQTDQSQFEMRQYDVIENDVIVEAIEVQARELGFSRMSMAFAPPRPVFLTVQDFHKLVEHRDGVIAGTLIDSAREQFRNLRIFFLHKAGVAGLDSRSTRGLHHAIEVLSWRRDGDRGIARLRIRNTGAATWLPSGHTIGAVNVGVQRGGADGTTALDYHRVHAFGDAVAAGEQREVEVVFPLAGAADHYVVDLVAEGIAWMGNVGAKPAVLR